MEIEESKLLQNELRDRNNIRVFLPLNPFQIHSNDPSDFNQQFESFTRHASVKIDNFIDTSESSFESIFDFRFIALIFLEFLKNEFNFTALTGMCLGI